MWIEIQFRPINVKGNIDSICYRILYYCDLMFIITHVNRAKVKKYELELRACLT